MWVSAVFIYRAAYYLAAAALNIRVSFKISPCIWKGVKFSCKSFIGYQKLAVVKIFFFVSDLYHYDIIHAWFRLSDLSLHIIPSFPRIFNRFSPIGLSRRPFFLLMNKKMRSSKKRKAFWPHSICKYEHFINSTNKKMPRLASGRFRILQRWKIRIPYWTAK